MKRLQKGQRGHHDKHEPGPDQHKGLPKKHQGKRKVKEPTWDQGR